MGNTNVQCNKSIKNITFYLSKPKLYRVKQNYYDVPYSVPINKVSMEYRQPVKISQ